ncbi:hypothetical protein LUZ60_001116 [Juncus effusus]|nr:hypothetical protein LUZ60_001116 [Juncus effusus]
MASSASSSSTPATWSDLPADLLCSILTLLPSIRDLLAFSSVCRSWRSLASSLSPSPASFFPPLLLRLTFLRRPRRRRRLVPSDLLLSDVCSSSSVNRSPIEAQSVLTLPFLSSSHGHLLFFSDHRRKRILIVDFITGSQLLSPLIPIDSAVPFCLANLTAPLSSPSSSLLLLARNLLFIWQVGRAEWIHHSLDMEIQFDSEMTVVGSRIYAMEINKIFSISMPELTVTQIPVSYSGNEDRMYIPSHRLVNRNGELLSVCFLADEPSESSMYWRLAVFRLDFTNPQPKWVKMESLGDWALFVNADMRVAGFACENPERWGGQSNSIYYSGLGHEGFCSWSVWRLGDEVVSKSGLGHYVFRFERLLWLNSQFRNAELRKWPDKVWVYPNILSEEKWKLQI